MSAKLYSDANYSGQPPIGVPITGVDVGSIFLARIGGGWYAYRAVDTGLGNGTVMLVDLTTFGPANASVGNATPQIIRVRQVIPIEQGQAAQEYIVTWPTPFADNNYQVMLAYEVDSTTIVDAFQGFEYSPNGPQPLFRKLPDHSGIAFYVTANQTGTSFNLIVNATAIHD